MPQGRTGEHLAPSLGPASLASLVQFTGISCADLFTVAEDYLAAWSPGARLTTSTRRFSGAFKSDEFFGLVLP